MCVGEDSLAVISIIITLEHTCNKSMAQSSFYSRIFTLESVYYKLLTKNVLNFAVFAKVLCSRNHYFLPSFLPRKFPVIKLSLCLQFPAVQMTPLLASGVIPTQEQLEAFQKQQVELLSQLQKQQQHQQGNTGG